MVSAVRASGFDYSGVGVTTTEMSQATSQVKDQVLTQEDFLKLLTTQLQAQDPTNPADNSEIVSQMSQLSMVDSLNSINSNMTNVIDTVNSSSTMSATNLIGTYVYTDDKDGLFDGSSTLSWAIDSGDEVYTNVKISIKDAVTGEVVYTDTADAISGEIKFAWPGIYSPDGPVEGGSGSEDVGVDTDSPADGSKLAKASAEGEDGGVDGSEDSEGTGGTDSDSDQTAGTDTDGDSDTPEYEFCTPGRYVLEVTATNSQGQSVALPSKALALVTSVTLGKTKEDTMLNLHGHGSMSFADATKVTL